MHKENHVFSTAYRDDEIEEIMNICDHVVFNSFNQWQKYQKSSKTNKVLHVELESILNVQLK